MQRLKLLAPAFAWLGLCVIFFTACANGIQVAAPQIDLSSTDLAQATPDSGAGKAAAEQTDWPSALTPPTADGAAPTEIMMPKAKPVLKLDKSQLRQAPAISSDTWINTPPLNPHALRGHVIVVSFWTFACYNCQNTLPYFKAWYQNYRSSGLIIIGVHTPELSFERDVDNVKQAVKDDGILYPIAIDADYSNWNRYHVLAWPTWFIVDKEGYIRYSHVGEGDYAVSEETIAALVEE